MHKDRSNGVGPFEDDLYGGILKDSAKFLTEARNIGDRDDTFFLTSKQVSGSMMRVAGFFSGSLIIQSG